MIARPVEKPKLRARSLNKFIRDHVDTTDAVLVTDEWAGYMYVKTFMPHMTINHQLSYANGEIHTNTIEGFWGLLKRGIMGQYHRVTQRHLHQYVNEFCYRYNNRNNSGLFDLTISRAVRS